MARDSLRLAAADFTRAREMAPRDASIRRAIGHFYIERGTWALAIPELETAVALDSSDAEAQYELARALFYDRRYDEALETYRRLTNRYPEHALARLGMGDLLYRAGDADPGRYAEAKAQLQQYVRLEPRDAKGWGLLGRTLHRLGEADSALAALEEAERLGEKNPESYLAMGLLYADRRDWERARATLERGQPGPREQKILAQIYEFTGHPGQADSLYVAALARDSTSADAAFVHRQRAKLRFRARNYAEAESLFARSIALDPGSGESWFYRGLCLKEMDQPDSSFLALRRAAEIDTAKADRFFWLGVVLDSRKQPDEAADAFRRAVEIDSTGELASRSFRQLGYYSLLERQWGTAIRWLERAAALDPEDAQTWLWMGQGHQNAGRREEAAKCYRRALSLDPDNVGAKKGLEVLGIGLVEPRGKEIPTATLERGNRAARRGATGRSEDERAHSRAGSGESRRA
jgi:tetratricopeptide (TPR) repeat protein